MGTNKGLWEMQFKTEGLVTGREKDL